MTKHHHPTKMTTTTDVELARQLLTRHPARDVLREAARRLMVLGEQLGETNDIARGTWSWTDPAEPPAADQHDQTLATIRPMTGAAPSAYS